MYAHFVVIIVAIAQEIIAQRDDTCQAALYVRNGRISKI